MNEEWKDI
jgi:dynein heavy chain